jgi:hypothetical protein
MPVTEDELVDATEWIERALLGDRLARVRVIDYYAIKLLAEIRELQRQLRERQTA